jgi:hypothetical protein
MYTYFKFLNWPSFKRFLAPLVQNVPYNTPSGSGSWYLLSQIGKGALQFPEGKHVISGAPIKELPLAHDSRTFVFIFVLRVL